MIRQAFHSMPVRLGLLFALIAITCAHFIPLMFRMFPAQFCSPEGITNGWCQNQNIWAGMIQTTLFQLTIVAVPGFFGGWLAAYHQRSKIFDHRMIAEIMLSFLMFLIHTVGFEVLWLEPWRPVRLPTGELINRFTYDALFASPLIIPFFLFALLVYILVRLSLSGIWRLHTLRSPRT